MGRGGAAVSALVMLTVLSTSTHAAGIRESREDEAADMVGYAQGGFQGSREQPQNNKQKAERLTLDISLDGKPVQIVPDLATIGNKFSLDLSELIGFFSEPRRSERLVSDTGILSLAMDLVSRSGLLPLLPRVETECGCRRGSNVCSCCATVSAMFPIRNRKGCVNIGYDPERVAVRANITLNDDTILDREIFSGANPPPICMPMPHFPIVNFCARMYNISLKGDRQFQVCCALETGLTFAQSLIRVRLGCINSGSKGISWQPMPADLTTNADPPENERLVVPPIKTHEETESDDSAPLPDGFFDTNAELKHHVYGNAEAK